MTETARRFEARRELWRRLFVEIPIGGRAVLDAGTGEGHFTSFLAERDPARLVSVTAVAEEVPAARARLGARGDRVEWVVADLSRLLEWPDSTFDVVAGDFLIAAVAAYSPFRELELLRELHRVLRPGGMLVLTGWDAGPPRRDELGETLRSLFRLREAVRTLAGAVGFREHPQAWLLARFADLGLDEVGSAESPDRHRDFTWFLEQIRGGIGTLPEPALRAALEERLRRLHTDLARVWPADREIEFGRLYGVTGRKPARLVEISE